MRFRVGFAFVAALALAAACSMTRPSGHPSSATATAKPASRCAPYTEPSIDAGPEDEPSAGRHAKATTTDDCEVADDNIMGAEQSVLTAPGGDPHRAEPWDKIAKPKYFDLVAARLLPTKAERKLLAQNSFVVRPFDTRPSYALAFHDVFQWELPIYVSADAILHAVYTSNDQLIDSIERLEFAPTLAKTLSALHCALGDTTKSYPFDVAHDLDLYLTVARSLLEDHPVKSVFGTDAEAAKLVAAANAANGMQEVELFGRKRVVDWSQYQPRGHYIDDRAAFFRATMWLGRLEFNLVSRSSRSSVVGAVDPSETPREATDALALADLTGRAGMLDDVAKLDRTWTLLAGKREDVSIGDLAAIEKRVGIDTFDTASFDKLKATIGTGWKRSARFHPMAEGATELPVIATFLGPRITPEAASLRLLTHTEVPDRHMLTGEDVAYVLGADRAKQHIRDLAKYPNLGAELDRARDTYAHQTDSGDLYTAWLGALSAGAKTPQGMLPGFMKTDAYADLGVDSLIAGYGQIRHNYVAVAAPGYDEVGCEIPDGYVEPRVGVYEQIAEYAKRGAAMMKEVDPTDKAGTKSYFLNLETIAKVLATISRHELEGRELTFSEKMFLGMVVETTPGSTGDPPTYTGWYFDLFRNRWIEAMSDAAFVSDYFTSTQDQKVAYAGATGPQMGIFVIDTGGEARLAVGPVARAFTSTSTSAASKRFANVTDVKTFDEPWAASYSAPSPKAVPFGLRAEDHPGAPNQSSVVQLKIVAPKAIASFEIDLLDHHGKIITNETLAIGAHDVTSPVIYYSRNEPPAGIRVHVGDYYQEGWFSYVGRIAGIESGGVAPPGTD